MHTASSDPDSALSPSAPATFALGVDFGGTKVEAALIDANGALFAPSRFRAPTGPTATCTELEASVTDVVTQAVAALPGGALLAGVGIGSAGPITVASGAVSPLNVAAWRDYPLADLVRSLVPDVPVRLRLDGLCITLAEHWVGAGQGVDNLMGMIVSTGVGGGLILGGRTISGPSGNAGHIGHVEVGGYDDACACGGRGCLEAIASGPKTVAWARRHGWTGTTGEELGAAHAAGDDIAVRAVQRSGEAIGHAIASATNLVDLDLVAIGGGFSHVSPALFDAARRTIAERTGFEFATRVQITHSALSGEGPLIGAAALIHRAELAP